MKPKMNHTLFSTGTLLALVALLLLGSVGPGRARAPGTIYTLTGDYVVPAGQTWTLSPGDVVRAVPGDDTAGGLDPGRVEILVYGTLVVDGPVTFTSAAADPQPADWYGIRILDGPQPAAIDGATIEYGVVGLSVERSATIRSCTVRYNRHDAYTDPVQGAGLWINNDEADTILVEGCQITDNTIDVLAQGTGSGEGAGLYLQGPGETTILDSVFARNTINAENSAYGAGLAHTEGALRLERSVFEENTLCGNQVAEQGAGAKVSSGARLDNNLFLRNQTTNCTDQVQGAGLYAAGEVDVHNNTFVDNGGAFQVSLQGQSGVALTFYNNVVTYDPDYLLPGNGIEGLGHLAAINLDYNDVWGYLATPYAGVAPGPHDLSADPLYLDPGNDDYHLAAGSPCINAGDGARAPAGDYDGDPRPISTGVDLGFDEYRLAALALGKTARDLNGPPLYGGDVLAYTLAVTNSEPYTATGLVLSDTLPLSTTFVAGSASPPQTSGPDPLVWAGQNVPAGETITFTFRVMVDPGAVGGTIANSASLAGPGLPLTSTPPVEPPGGGTVTPTLPLSMAKAARDLNGAPLYEGDVVEYTITLTNPGAGAHGDVLVEDPIPSGTTYVPGSASPPQTSGPDPLAWSLPQVEAGQVLTFTFRVVVDPGMAGGQIGGNVSSVTSGQMPTPTVNPPAWPPGGGTVDPTPELQVTKTALDLNGPPLYGGDTIEYTIVATNTGAAAHTNLVLSDTAPAYTSYLPGSAATSQGTIAGTDPLVVEVGTLDPDQVMTVTFRVTVDTDAAGQTIENQAQVHSDQLPPIITPPVVPPGSGGGGVQPYLTLAKVGGDVDGPPLLAGDQVEYHVLLFNPAPITATQVTITDHVPAGTTYVPGSATTTRGTISGPNPLVVDIPEQPALSTTFLKFRVTVDPVTALASVTNTATAAIAGHDPVTAQSVLGPVGGEEVGLVIGKIAADLNGPPLYEGDVVEYTLGLANTDTTPHTNVVVSDAIPYGTTYVPGSAEPPPSNAPDPLVWDVKSLPAKEIVFFTFRVTVDAGMAGQQIGGNVALARSDQQAEAVQTPPVYPGPVSPGEPPGQVRPGALSIAKVALDLDGAPLHEGDAVRYAITVTNQTTDTTHTNVVVEDALPLSTTYVAGSASPAQESGPDPLVWTVASLAPGESRAFTFEVTVDEGTAGQNIGSNVAGVHSDQMPPLITPPTTPPSAQVVEPDPNHYFYLPLVVKNHVTEPPPPPGGDGYEPDNACSQATAIQVGAPQTHTFDPAGDVDWVKLEMTAGRTYLLQTGALQGGADTILQLYAGDCIVLLAENDDYGGYLWSRIEWLATETGPFYLRIRNYDPTDGGEGVSYTIGVQELP